jgi:hypothetical protein
MGRDPRACLGSRRLALSGFRRGCHDQTDAPYERGRLVVTALGAGQFTFEVVQRAAGGTSPARVSTFAHVGKTDARDVARGPDGTIVNGQSDAP